MSGECNICGDNHAESHHIPQGVYCYSYEGGPCPFWSINPNKPHQQNGHCSYLNVGDWQGNEGGLLWDKIKECGVNTDEV